MFGYVLFIVILLNVHSLPFTYDNKLLSLILKEHYLNGGYTVVMPKTTIHSLESYISSNTSWIVNGYDCYPLLHQLIEKNRQSVELTIESDPLNGYILDKDGRFLKYFSKNGGEWKKLYEESRSVHNLTSVSLPVYDKQTNLVMVYKGFSAYCRTGVGNLIIYSFNSNNGTLNELMKEMLWIS